MTIVELNTATEEAAAEALVRCCGSRAWVAAMLSLRPYADAAALLAAADHADAALGEADWREAFAHHPRIGDVEGLRAQFASQSDWAGREQAGAAAADEAALRALAEGNRAYEARFGHLYIVCATGLSASEMLARLHDRMANAAAAELRIAAGEQAMITRLRLAKLLAEGS